MSKTLMTIGGAKGTIFDTETVAVTSAIRNDMTDGGASHERGNVVMIFIQTLLTLIDFY